jgi:ATP-binding cassette subfamily C protein
VNHTLAAFSDFATQYSRSGVYKLTIGELPRLFLVTIAVLALLGAAAVLVLQRRPMQEIVPTLTLLALASVRMMPSANRIVNSAVYVRWGVPALDAVYADLKELEQLTANDRREKVACNPHPFEEAIEFECVTYRYPGAASDALRCLSFRIPKGSAVAFVGASGAGKSTAADVLLGLLEPQSGRVLVDGEDIQRSLSGWQRQIGYIPQQIFLTDDTIRRNVAFGIPDEEIDEERVRGALESAQLLKFVESLPAGLNTSVGERGVRLSGGQLQRIGIARALYHDPEVLVMDEATSALDYKTESLIIEMIENLRDSRTIVVIAHRHSTIQYFDTVLKLHDGQLVAQGSYSEVVAASATS